MDRRNALQIDPGNLRRLLDDAARGLFFVRPAPAGRYEVVQGTAYGLKLIQYLDGPTREAAEEACQQHRDRWVSEVLTRLMVRGF